jgi:hypothetical protein
MSFNMFFFFYFIFILFLFLYLYFLFYLYFTKDVSSEFYVEKRDEMFGL